MASIADYIVNTAALPSTRCLTTTKGSHSAEAELVSWVKAGDQVAFRELVERYERRVFGVIFGILRNRENAEEIAQEVFAKVYFSIRTFDGRCSLYTWIYRIAVNECYGFLRKQRRKLACESHISDDMCAVTADMHPRPDRATIERDFVNKLLARVAENDRLLLLWKEVEGLSLEELVKLTGLNKNTIKVRLHRTRQLLMKAARRLQSTKGRI